MGPTEVRPPCLYLVWPSLTHDVPQPVAPHGYEIRTYRSGDEAALLKLQGSDGEPMGEQEWHAYRDSLLPDGLFLVEHRASAELVATAGAVHNPNPGRYYFPFGGELGYLIVAPEHRGRALGGVVCAAVVRRFVSAGYKSIRVCVQEHRLPAIRTYLRLGFVPFLHSAAIQERWHKVYEVLNLAFAPEQWPTKLE